MVNGSPDPFSMSLVAIPMTTLYFVGLGCARLVDRGESNQRSDARSKSTSRHSTRRGFAPRRRKRSTRSRNTRRSNWRNGAGRRRPRAGDGHPRPIRRASTNADDEEERPKQPPEQQNDENGLTTAVEGTAARMASVFTEEEKTEDDIGGYYYDLRFVVGSLRGKSVRLAGVFMAVVAVSFTFLYGGGIGAIKRDFLTELPAGVNPNALNIVLLHPVEALAFEMKVSLIAGAVAVLPLVLYYAWPAIESRLGARADRNVFLVWGGAMTVGLLGGSFVGYRYVAPEVISYLVADARAADMIIAYRTAAFFWLVFALTAGVGLLAEIPVTMLLFHHGNVVPYRTMRRRWREVSIGVLFVAAMLPGGLLLMLFVALAVMVAYGVGLAVLWVDSLGGRLLRVSDGIVSW